MTMHTPTEPLRIRFSAAQLTPAQQEAVALRRRIDELERQVAGLQAALADANAACERAMLGRERQETL